MYNREQITHRLNEVGQDVKEAGRNVWLAGLGAVDVVDERGRSLFNDLVTRGQKVDADELLGGSWRETRVQAEKLGKRFERDVEHRMTGMLHRLNIPARDDVRALARRVEKLTRKVEGLAKA